MEFNPLLEGAYELHVHSYPSIFKRKQTDWELLEDARKANMGGFVIKSHETPTAERAFLLKEKEPAMNVFGGIVLNEHVGGLNPHAVETSLKMGGKIVWFPTLSSSQHKKYFAGSKTNLFSGNPLLSESTISIERDGVLKEEVHAIFELIKQYDAILATGHLSLKDQHTVIRAAKEAGVEKILVQHADMGIAKTPLGDQQYFASLGCMIEKCFLACGPDFNDLTIEEMARTIDVIGHEQCVLVTDYGQSHNEPPVHALNRFVEELLGAGVAEDQIVRMVQENPRWLLGIE